VTSFKKNPTFGAKMATVAATGSKTQSTSAENPYVEHQDARVAAISAESFETTDSNHRYLTIIAERDREIEVLKSRLNQSTDPDDQTESAVDQLLSIATAAIAENDASKLALERSEAAAEINRIEARTSMHTSRVDRCALRGGATGMSGATAGALLIGGGPVVCALAALVGGLAGTIIGSEIGSNMEGPTGKGSPDDFLSFKEYIKTNVRSGTYPWPTSSESEIKIPKDYEACLCLKELYARSGPIMREIIDRLGIKSHVRATLTKYRLKYRSKRSGPLPDFISLYHDSATLAKFDEMRKHWEESTGKKIEDMPYGNSWPY
jgi:hypothetical protein